MTAITLKLVFVDPATATGEGTFKWDIDGVELAQILSMVITDLSDDSAKPAIDLLDDSDPAAEPETKLDAGFYLVTVTAQKNLLTAASGADIAVWTDVLHVYNGLTTSVKLADTDFAYSSNIAGVWVNGKEATAGNDGSFSYILVAATDEEFTIALTSDGKGAAFVPAADEEPLGLGGEASIVFAPFDADATADPEAVTEWTIETAGTYTLTIHPWPVNSAKLEYSNADVEFTVTFNYKDDEDDDTTATATVNYGQTVKAEDFPDITPEQYYGLSWNTKSDGTGTTFDATTTVTANIAVYAIIKFVGGTPYVDTDGSLVHEYPLLSVTPGATHGTWNGTAKPDGTFTITTGGIRYAFSAVDAVDDHNDYDFIDIYYTASGVNSIVYKHYNSSDDYTRRNSNAITTGSGSISFILKQTASGGFAIQKYGAGTPAQDMDIQITKIIFTKGTRYDVPLELDGGTGAPASIYLVDGTAAGIWLPTPTKEGHNFTGWFMPDATTQVTATTVVNEDFEDITLTAHWQMIVNVTPLTVDFTGMTFRKISNPTITVIESGAGYEYEYQSGSGNNWSLGAFTVTLQSGATLADYDVVTFNLQGIGGDFNYKNLLLLDSATATSGGFDASALTVAGPEASGDTATAKDFSLTINKTKASTLSGAIEVAIYMSASASTGDPAVLTKYRIKNVVFKKN